MIRNALPLLLAGLLLVPAGVAQESVFADFQFDQMRFQFWPNGLENKPDTDGKGSAITVSVLQVTITGANAVELRHCIDGDSSYCSYSIPGGNNNGTVTTDEVESFQGFARIGLAGSVPKVKDLMNKLKTNITVDGVMAKKVSITDVQFTGAEGKVSSEKTIIVNIDAKATYDNDGKAVRHVVLIHDLTLFPDFEYKSVVWKPAVTGWGFDPAVTKPESAKGLVNSQGYYSNQVQFEQLSAQGIEFGVAKGAGGTGKKSPGLDATWILLSAAFATFIVGRNRK